MKVWVVVYDHEYGQDVNVFENEESAKACRERIARDWWDHEFPDEDMPATNVADAYFEKILDSADPEYCTVLECHVKS